MPSYSPDYTQEFKQLDPGTYTAKVESFEEKSSKKDGTPYLQWTLNIVDKDYKGAKVWMITMLSGRGAGILKHFLKTCDGEYAGGEFDPADYIDSKIGVEVETREFNGKSIVGVRDVFPLSADQVDEESSFEDESDIPF